MYYFYLEYYCTYKAYYKTVWKVAVWLVTLCSILQVMDRALFHSDASYKIPNIRVTGYLCKTNIPSNTAFRGFGGPQGMFIAETWIEHIAKTLDISVKQVSNSTPFLISN